MNRHFDRSYISFHLKLDRRTKVTDGRGSPNKQSEPARYVKENTSHAFEWRTLTIVQNWLGRRITEALHIAAYCPELNGQVQSFELTLFPRGIRIT